MADGKGRTYTRDANGRFASGGGGIGGGRPKARAVTRGANRITRSNSGRITSVGGTGATARGGRLRTAAGKQRATQFARVGKRAQVGTVGKPKGLIPGSMSTRASSVASAPKAQGKAGRPLGGSTSVARLPMQPKNTMKPPLSPRRMIKEQGGSRWQKAGKDRIYFNGIAQRAGLKTSHYKSGYVSNATYRGQGISNSRAAQMEGVFRDAKVFYDAKTRKITANKTDFLGRAGREAASAVGKVARQITRNSRMQVKRPRKTRST